MKSLPVAGAVLLTTQICLDGKSNWLNGLQMLVLYTIIAVLFFFRTGDGRG